MGPKTEKSKVRVACRETERLTDLMQGGKKPTLGILVHTS